MLWQLRPDLDYQRQVGVFLQENGQAGGKVGIFDFRKFFI
jgi:hypothetical protein